MSPRLKQAIRCASALGGVILGALGSGEASAQAAASGRMLRVNGMEMYVEVRGTGDALLLLHGFGSCGKSWAQVADSLAGRYQLVVPDLRGHGRSTNPSGTFTHRQSALDVYALLDQLGVTRFKAMGISTGGMTLLHMATQQRDRIDAMVLIGATTEFPEPARAIMRSVSGDSLSSADRRHFATCAARGDPQIRELAGQFARFRDSYDDMNFTAPFLGTIRARTLIVHGDRDEFFPVDIPVGMYRAIPKAALWIVPRGDHVPIFGRHLREFLQVTADFLANPR
jgi:pimeloyl-ACP methyl ester carboxylesterase